MTERQTKTAVGNLDLSSYDALLRREDVLSPTGPYPVGQLLLKGGEAVETMSGDAALTASRIMLPPTFQPAVGEAIHAARCEAVTSELS